jgi:threonine/homoserine/homoserine lactone efflux protein
MFAARGASMEKGMSWGCASVGGIMLLFFILDIAVGVPFGGLSKVVDIFGILAAAILLYLSIETIRELR